MNRLTTVEATGDNTYKVKYEGKLVRLGMVDCSKYDVCSTNIIIWFK